jgi:hypothetical protein
MKVQWTPGDYTSKLNAGLYRKSILDKAGVQPPTTIDELIAASKALNTKDQKGLFIGNDAGVTPSFGGSLPGPILWTVGNDYLTADNKPGFTTPEVKQSFEKTRELFLSKTILLGAPTDWWDPSSFTQGARRHAVVRNVGRQQSAWTPKMNNAYADAATAIVPQGWRHRREPGQGGEGGQRRAHPAVRLRCPPRP